MVATIGESLAADTPAVGRRNIGTYQTHERPSGWETPGAVVSSMVIDINGSKISQKNTWPRSKGE